MRRVPEIDGLRLLACLAVVLYHFFSASDVNSVTQFGYLGVNLFFMISGFVILWSAQETTLRSFLIARFTRLYPCFWLCIAFSLPLLAYAGKTHDLKTIVANASMVGGLMDIPYINDVYWTLLVELKFYFLVGVLLFLRQADRIESWLVGWLVLCLVHTQISLHPALASLLIIPYAPLFIAGCVFYLIHSKGWTAKRLALIAGCCWLVLPWSVSQAGSFMAGSGEVAATLMAGVFGVMALIASGRLRIRSHRSIVALSALTYPLYLIHTPVQEAIVLQAGPVGAIFAAVLLALIIDRVDRPVARLLRGWLTEKARVVPPRPSLIQLYESFPGAGRRKT